jgi:putative tricarboxylic transport membrane protein
MDHLAIEENDDERGGGWAIRNSNRASGLLICLIAGLALFASRDLPYGSIGSPDAGFFPRSLSVLLLIFGTSITAASFGGRIEKVRLSSNTFRVMVAAIALCAYALTLDVVGFVIGTILILLLMMRGFGEMSWRASGLIAVGSVVLAYVGFLQLGVPLPKGPLPF